MEKEILRLFKGYLAYDVDFEIKQLNQEALKYGLAIPFAADEKVVNEAIKMYGKDGEKWNRTFHKDFEIVKNAPIGDLIAQQMVHYYTTYGFESLGIFDNDLVYLPKEKLEIPELSDEDIEFIVIHPILKEELTQKLMDLLVSGIALSEQTVKDIMKLSDFIDKDRFDEIKNKEIRIALYDKYNIMPRNPEEFLRFLILKTTGSTLKIQNKETFYTIKNSNFMIKKQALSMLQSYVTKTPNGYSKLASIFLRNKTLFLAFKINKKETRSENDDKIRLETNKIINKLRKLSVKYHNPLKTNILDSLSYDVVNIQDKKDELIEALDKATIFRIFRVLNGLKYRLNADDNSSILYKIRNGKSYVSDLKNTDSLYKNRLSNIYDIIYNYLIDRISSNVKDKLIYIPENVTYTVPTSEKQFNDNVPTGSYVEIPREQGDLICGVHWTNLDGNGNKESSFYGEINNYNEERVDLDLHMVNKDSVFGWDALYRNNNRNILFSGDVTNAPISNGGATELFYIGKNNHHCAFILTLNNFTRNDRDVPFEFVIAKSTKNQESGERVNYTLNPNNIILETHSFVKANEAQKFVGFVAIDDDKIKVYFNDFSQGNNRTSRNDENVTKTFEYLNNFNAIQLKLRDVLKDAGAILTTGETYQKTTISYYEKLEDNTIEKITSERADELTRNGNGHLVLEQSEISEVPVDVNLSLESITKESIINLFN